jgi:hypothetical protein
VLSSSGTTPSTVRVIKPNGGERLSPGHDWTVSDRPGSNYKIVVIARDAAGNFGEDESYGTFEIQ